MRKLGESLEMPWCRCLHVLATRQEDDRRGEGDSSTPAERALCEAVDLASDR
jgi:hypothetical protein